MIVMDEWQGNKCILGKPWSFTKYTLKNGIISCSRGILAKDEEQLQLYRILDLDVHQSFLDRICNQGTIILHTESSDFIIEKIQNPLTIKTLLNNKITEQRIANGVRMIEGIDDIDKIPQQHKDMFR